MAAAREALRYLDQVVDDYDPSLGLALPEQVAWAVSLDVLESGRLLEDPEATWRAHLAALLRDPLAPRLRTLILHDCSEHTVDACDIPFEEADPLPLLRKHPGRLARLERLHVGVFPPELPPESGFCAGVAPALAGLPALQYLHMVGERGWELVPAGGHPRLRALLLHVAEADDDPLLRLERAPFPALARLDLWAGPALLAEADLAALADALARFGSLRELALRGLDGPELLAEVIARGALELHALAITHAPALGDDDLAALLSAPWLAKLRRLDLGGTAISAALADELRARGPEVVC